MQTRTQSFLESMLQVSIGYVLAFITQMIVFPFFGMHPRLWENATIGFIFMAVSLARSYSLRRVFNLFHRK